jgi:aryl-alcohol dehydrogenase-like predicted oxidoreductase
MRHRLLGGSGLRVSELCLGSLTFGETKPWGADPEAAAAILGIFADAGGTFIDTAPNYAGGAAEEIVGRFVAGRRDGFALATKYTASTSRHPLAGGNSRKSLRQSVEASLRRLDTDHIDLLWLHFWDGTTPTDEIVRGIDDLISAGKILYWGISDTPAWLVSRAVTMAQLVDRAAPVAIQIEYNVMARTPERELLPMAKALDLGVVCWGPLAAGALAGGREARRSASLTPPSVAAEALAELAEQSDNSMIGLALGWLLASGQVPLVGARTAEQLAQQIAFVEQFHAAPLDDAIIERIGTIAPPDLGFPHTLIGSSYLRRFALGDPDRLIPAERARG